ncbi:hypothetical protein FF011L_06130 [Roseimaritima multifibrata]|uniref:TIR domain-containing protein n=1 Tax=Roseimaritima multifibrata TaxID=1930274 RepID=A0A517MAR4_9BACT|nr:hypothetical protein [Roseimaritima multifibrata]QDS91877.1 hypothetical protein FF011L_06130 [Roseimaritima multifibrata]
MKIFISWSGARSKHIATALRDWLPSVIQSVSPFISSQDILKGARGNVQIAKELETAAVGIICLTPENLNAPWILFEAGALSKLSSAYVCTYLHELEPSDISQPLGQFQHTNSTREDTLSLVQTINNELPDGTGLEPERLRDAFEIWWKKLEVQIKAVPSKPDEEVSPPERTEEDKIDEMLQMIRKLSDAKVNRPATLASALGMSIEHDEMTSTKPYCQFEVDLTKVSKTKRLALMNRLKKHPNVFDVRRVNEADFYIFEVAGHSMPESATAVGEIKALLQTVGVWYKIHDLR